MHEDAWFVFLFTQRSMPDTITEDLYSRFMQVEEAVKRLKDGADVVRATLMDTKYNFLLPSF